MKFGNVNNARIPIFGPFGIFVQLLIINWHQFYYKFIFVMMHCIKIEMTDNNIYITFRVKATQKCQHRQVCV